MCSSPKPQVVQAAPTPPPPPPTPKLVSPEEDTPNQGTNAVSSARNAGTARSKLRIDLNPSLGTGTTNSSGLGIPQA